MSQVAYCLNDQVLADTDATLVRYCKPIDTTPPGARYRTLAPGPQSWHLLYVDAAGDLRYATGRRCVVAAAEPEAERPPALTYHLYTDDYPGGPA